MNGDFPLLAQALEQGMETGPAGGDVEAVLGTLGLPDAVYHSFEPPPDGPEIAWVRPSAALGEVSSAQAAFPEPQRQPPASVMPKLSPSFPPAQPANAAAPCLSPRMPMRERDPAPAARLPPLPTPTVSAPAMPSSPRPAPARLVSDRIASARPAPAGLAPTGLAPTGLAPAGLAPAGPQRGMAPAATPATEGAVTLSEVFQTLSGRPAAAGSTLRSLRDVFGAG